MGRRLGVLEGLVEEIARHPVVVAVVLFASVWGASLQKTGQQVSATGDVAGGGQDAEAEATSHGVEARLTERRYPRGRPLIYGDVVLWQEGPDIAVHDLGSGTTGYLGFGTDTSLTAFWGDRYTVEVEDDGSLTGYVYDLGDRGPPVTLYSGLTARAHPVLNGDRVVWEDRGHVRLYDFGTGTFSTLTTGDSRRPWLDGDLVAYEAAVGGTWDVYVRDLATDEDLPVAVGPGPQTAPVVCGLWVLYTDFTTGNGDIYAFNLVTGTRYRLTSAPATEAVSAMYEGRAVWHAGDADGSEVYMVALPPAWTSDAPGAAVNVTEHRGSQRNPAVDTDRIVWQDDRDGGWDIRVLTLAE